MVKAVILDLDGTLINSHPAHVKSFNKMLELHGLVINNIDFSKYFGLIAEDILKRLFPSLSDEEVSALARTKRRLFIKDIDLVTKQPCVDEFIKSLKGLKTAIATSASREEMEAVITKFGWSFDYLLTSYEVSNPKPAPDIIIRAAKELRVKLSDCVFIGDSIYDADTARNAGVRFIGVATGSYSIKDFTGKGVKAFKNLCSLLSSGVLHNL